MLGFEWPGRLSLAVKPQERVELNIAATAPEWSSLPTNPIQLLRVQGRNGRAGFASTAG